jgi:hypothetical protein
MGIRAKGEIHLIPGKVHSRLKKFFRPGADQKKSKDRLQGEDRKIDQYLGQGNDNNIFTTTSHPPQTSISRIASYTLGRILLLPLRHGQHSLFARRSFNRVNSSIPPNLNLGPIPPDTGMIRSNSLPTSPSLPQPNTDDLPSPGMTTLVADTDEPRLSGDQTLAGSIEGIAPPQRVSSHQSSRVRPVPTCSR